MKKILLLILCLVLTLTGCSRAAVPFYDQTSDDIVFESEYSYSFTDDTYVFCNWTNNTGSSIYFLDEYDIDQQTKDGKWINVGNHSDLDSGDVEYSHMVSPGNTSMAKYDFSAFDLSLEDGFVYRVSTYCYDEAQNYFQVYAEFTCSDESAEAEIEEIITKSLDDAESAAEQVNVTENTEESDIDIEDNTESATDAQNS